MKQRQHHRALVRRLLLQARDDSSSSQFSPLLDVVVIVDDRTPRPRPPPPLHQEPLALQRRRSAYGGDLHPGPAESRSRSAVARPPLSDCTATALALLAPLGGVSGGLR